MRYIFSILLCLIIQTGFSQIIKTVGISYTNGTPTYTPAKAGSALALDTVTWRYYTWNGSTWLSDGFRVQTISGCSAPAYTPTKFQSLVVINACNDAQGGPEIYKWSGNVWEKSGGTAYTAGTGIAISGGNVISNIGDLSATNELNTSLSISGSNLQIIDAGGTLTVPVSSIAPVQAVAAGAGISIAGTTTRTVTNTAPDQTVAIAAGTGIGISGTYPSFTVTNSSPNVVQTLSIAGQDLSLSGGGGTVAIPGTAIPSPRIPYGSGTGLTSVNALNFDTTNYFTLPQRVLNIGDSTTYSSRRLEGLHIKNRFGVPGGVYRGINYTPFVIESPTKTSESLDFRFRQSVASSQSYPGTPGSGCTNCPSDSTRNEVMTWGFNENGSQKSNMPGIHYALEPGWYNGGQFWQEAHLEFYSPYFLTAPFTAVYGAGRSIRRLFTTEVQNIKNPLLTTNVWNFVGDGFNMNSLKGNAQYFKTDFNESTGAAQIVLWGGRTGISGVRTIIDTINNIHSIDRVGSYSSTTSRFDFAGYSRYDWRNDLGATIFSYQRAANSLLFGSTGIRNSFYFQANNYNSGDGLLVSGDLTNSSYLNRGHIWLYNAGFSRNWHLGYRSDADFAYMSQDGGTTGFSASFKKYSFGASISGSYPQGTAYFNVYTGQPNTVAALLLQTSADSAKIFLTSVDPNSILTGRVGNVALGTNGNFYFKATGNNTNTGWINLGGANPNTFNGNYTATGTATTAFTVTLPATQPDATYSVSIMPKNALSATGWYISARTTTTFEVTYLTGLTGAVDFDYIVIN